MHESDILASLYMRWEIIQSLPVIALCIRRSLRGTLCATIAQNNCKENDEAKDTNVRDVNTYRTSCCTPYWKLFVGWLGEVKLFWLRLNLFDWKVSSCCVRWLACQICVPMAADWFFRSLAIFGWRLLSTRYCEQAGPSETPKLVMSFDRSVDFRHLQENDGYGLKTLETLQKPWMVLDSKVLRKTNENWRSFSTGEWFWAHTTSVVTGNQQQFFLCLRAESARVRAV